MQLLNSLRWLIPLTRVVSLVRASGWVTMKCVYTFQFCTTRLGLLNMDFSTRMAGTQVNGFCGLFIIRIGSIQNLLWFFFFLTSQTTRKLIRVQEEECQIFKVYDLAVTWKQTYTNVVYLHYWSQALFVATKVLLIFCVRLRSVLVLFCLCFFGV